MLTTLLIIRHMKKKMILDILYYLAQVHVSESIPVISVQTSATSISSWSRMNTLLSGGI